MKQENANKNDTKRAIKNNPAAIEKVRNNPIYNKYLSSNSITKTIFCIEP